MDKVELNIDSRILAKIRQEASYQSGMEIPAHLDYGDTQIIVILLALKQVLEDYDIDCPFEIDGDL